MVEWCGLEREGEAVWIEGGLWCCGVVRILGCCGVLVAFSGLVVKSAMGDAVVAVISRRDWHCF